MVSWKGAVVLVAVLLALGIYAFQSRPGTQSAKPAAGLLPCDVVETIDLRITGSGGKVMEARRAAAGQDWQLASPAAEAADSAVIDDLVATAAQLTSTDTLKSVPSGQDLGLDPARMTLTCTLRKGASYTLSVGVPSFDGSGSYARVGGDAKVRVIPSTAVGKFQKALDQPPIRSSPSPSGSPSPSPSA
jgi:hypothetical protein